MKQDKSGCIAPDQAGLVVRRQIAIGVEYDGVAVGAYVAGLC